MTAARLALYFEKGLTGGDEVVVNQHVGKDGYVQRVIEFDHPLGNWDIGYGIRDISDYQLARSIFKTHQTARAFRFYAPAEDDHYVSDQVLGTGTGSRTDFAFIKTWTAGSYSYDKSIYCLVDDAATITVNNVSIGSAWTLIKPTSPTTAAVFARLNVAPPAGQIVRATFYYDTPVIFTNKRLNQQVEFNNIGRLRGLNVREVRENPDL